MNFKLPKLDQVIKLTKDNQNDVANHIFVRNGVAILSKPYIILCVNLREYIKRELKVDQSDDIEKMDEILDWFEGKHFTKEFWKELTSVKYVSLNKNGLLIEEASYEKSLIYEEAILDADEVESTFRNIRNAFSRKDEMGDIICFNSSVIADIQKVFGGELKVDDLIFKSAGSNKPTLFSGRLKDYIFGSFAVLYDESNELMSFDNVREFLSNFN